MGACLRGWQQASCDADRRACRRAGIQTESRIDSLRALHQNEWRSLKQRQSHQNQSVTGGRTYSPGRGPVSGPGLPSPPAAPSAGGRA